MKKRLFIRTSTPELAGFRHELQDSQAAAKKSAEKSLGKGKAGHKYDVLTAMADLPTHTLS